MPKVEDIGLTLGFDVPFVWHDARRGRERFGRATEALPVTIRGVAPELVTSRLEPFDPKGPGGTAFLRHYVDGEPCQAYLGCPLAEMTAPGAAPKTLTFAAAHLPSAISPPPGELRRAARQMRLAAVEYPIEAAAARLRRIAAEELVHDGSYVYRLDRGGPEARADSGASAAFLRRCCLVMQAGDRTLGDGETGTALAETLARLRRVTLSSLIDDLDAEGRAAGDEVVRDAARILSRSHPVERDRRRMERIAKVPVGLDAEDAEALEALSP